MNLNGISGITSDPINFTRPLGANCIALAVGQGDGCVQIMCGTTPLYLHGSTDEIRQFALRIITAAVELDERDRKEVPV